VGSLKIQGHNKHWRIEFEFEFRAVMDGIALELLGSRGSNGKTWAHCMIRGTITTAKSTRDGEHRSGMKACLHSLIGLSAKFQ